MARNLTVREIAGRLGISPSTVSRVLNGSQLVREETRATVERTAREMGYRKRTIRRHAPRSVLVIALFLPRPVAGYHRLFYDPADLLAGLTGGFGEIRTQIPVIVNQPNPDLFTSKKCGNIDACVFGFTTPTPDVKAVLRERAIPFVLLNREPRDGSFVAIDHLTGMRGLLQRVGRYRPVVRPCYISFTPARPVAVLREASFLDACNLDGIKADENDIYRVDAIDEIDADMLHRLVERYNTVLCFNDVVAVYLYQVALLEGMRIPQDLSLAGYDNSSIRSLTPQKIDSVSFSPYDLGYNASEWLRRVIIDRSSESLQIRLRGEVIPGETLIYEEP